mmetsp:Transcript_63251/g.164353  ORF Transcript_63251/g.164353 Transcript_63251/m.164353 type:complete len:231 (-) Transcript_63251:488-1180(-)
MLPEPADGVRPALPEADHGPVAKVTLDCTDAEPAVHEQHPDREARELWLQAEPAAHGLTQPAHEHHQPGGQVALAPDGLETHVGDHRINVLPEDAVALWMWVGIPVRGDVELPKRRMSWSQHLLAQYQRVRVVVHVREADAVAARPEHAQLAQSAHLEDVRQEQVVPGAVDLVWGDRDGEQTLAARLAHQELSFCLRLGVFLDVRGLRQRRHLLLGGPVGVRGGSWPESS